MSDFDAEPRDPAHMYVYEIVYMYEVRLSADFNTNVLLPDWI